MDHPDDKARRKGGPASHIVPYLEWIEPPRRERLRPDPEPEKGKMSKTLLVAAAAFVGLTSITAFHVLSSRAPRQSTPAAATLAANDRATDSQTSRQAVATLATLEAEVQNLRATLTRQQALSDPTYVMRKLDELAASLTAVKSDTRSALAELAGKIDPLRQETISKLHSVAERLDRLEHQAGTGSPTAAIAPRPGAAFEPRAAGPKGAPHADWTESAKAPPVIRSWVVRDVYDGLALVEGAEGAMEVAPGEMLPGAGRVRSIERRGRGWIVVTSRGVIDQARGPLAP